MIQRNAIDPVHEEHGVLLSTSIWYIYEELALEVSELHEVGRLDVLELLCNHPIALTSLLLITEEALEGVVLTRRGLHLKDYGEVAAAHDGMPLVVIDQAQIFQLAEAVFGIAQRLDIITYRGIVHRGLAFRPDDRVVIGGE